VTICIAALFRWNYGTNEQPNWQYAALAISDRMITTGDVTYEPNQTKIAQFTPTTMGLIAGDYSISPERIANLYGHAVQEIKLKQAEDIYLAPLGLNSDSFLAQQKDMAPHFVSLLTEQMQAYPGEDVDALIIGAHDGIINIYGVDRMGIVYCYDDVGFAAIGSGSGHVKSRLTQVGYTSHNLEIAPALAITYAAKKISQVAPGVGVHEDIHLVFKDHYEMLPYDWWVAVRDLYDEYRPKAEALSQEYVTKLRDTIIKPKTTVQNESEKGIAGSDAQANERPSAPAAQAAPRNEAGPKLIKS
jgi:20S proteasome alpha/beta subunit